MPYPLGCEGSMAGGLPRAADPSPGVALVPGRWHVTPGVGVLDFSTWLFHAGIIKQIK